MENRIVPTVFVLDEVALVDRLELYEDLVESVQLDIADKGFSLRPTLGVERMVSQVTSLKREVHLMVVEPIDWLQLCADETVEVVVGHIENMSNQKEFVEEGKNLGLKIGLAVDLETEIGELDWAVAKECDQLLMMTVRAGREKQSLSEKGLLKVGSLRKKGYEGEICVDGGVNETTIKRCVKAGADVLAIGSALWKATNVKKKYEEIRRLTNEV